ncbi:MAG: DUF6089 family protein [Bacteroidota bacterium]
MLSHTSLAKKVNEFNTDSLQSKNTIQSNDIAYEKIIHSYPYFKKYTNPLLSPFSYHFGLGITGYKGDLSTPPDFVRQKNHLTPFISLGIQYRLTHYVSLRFEASGFQLYSEPTDERKNLIGFQSLNTEAHISVIHEFVAKSSVESYAKKLSPYIWGGIGGIFFNPKSLDDDSNMLNSADTTVSNFSLVFPLGVGINYYLNERINIALEGGARLTQTTLLDGNISEESNNTYDRYFFLGAKVIVQLKTRYKYKRYLKRQVKNRPHK